MPIEKRQLKPGPKRVGGLSYLRPPPEPPEQKSVRYGNDLIERAEQRCLEMSLRLGRTVKFAELARRGLELALGEPLPEYAKGKDRVPCGLVRQAGGGMACVTCNMRVPGLRMTCTRLKREVELRDE